MWKVRVWEPPEQKLVLWGDEEDALMVRLEKPRVRKTTPPVVWSPPKQQQRKPIKWPKGWERASFADVVRGPMAPRKQEEDEDKEEDGAEDEDMNETEVISDDEDGPGQTDWSADGPCWAPQSSPERTGGTRSGPNGEITCLHRSRKRAHPETSQMQMMQQQVDQMREMQQQMQQQMMILMQTLTGGGGAPGQSVCVASAVAEVQAAADEHELWPTPDTGRKKGKGKGKSPDNAEKEERARHAPY